MALVVAVLLGIAQAGSATNPPGFTCQGNPHYVTPALGNWNTGGVSGGGTSPTFDTGSAYYCLDEIDTYHTSASAGSTGGTVSLTQGATTLGPYAATPQGATPGFYNWAAPVTAGTVIHGSYTCHDSDPSSWAQNAQSSGQGFCKFLVEDAVDSGGPTVNITSPAANADLNGTVTVSANASDNVGVDHVTFQIRDIVTETTTSLGTVSSAPYSVSFPTTTVPNCEHDGCTITATAYDAAGNSSSDSVNVGIANPIVVGTTSDAVGAANCSLRDAIASANNNDAEGGCLNGLSSLTDTIDVPAGTYNLSVGQLLISGNVNIVGAGARSTVIAGYSTGQRIFEITGASEVEIGGVTIEGGTETGNSGTDNPGVGGGIWLDSESSLILRDSTVTGNEADVSGGGIDSDGSLEIIRSTIENNNTPGFGAGIDDFGSALSIYTSTIMGNLAQGDGGGLFLAGPATLTNDTIAYNEAAYSTSTGSGGGIGLFGTLNPQDVTLANTLLAGNTIQRGALLPDNCAGPVSSSGNNLADDASCGLTIIGDQQNVDPQLGPVDTSGPEDVLPLLAGSPAIDAANDMLCPDRDEILTHRPQGTHCDIGAYEYVPPPSDYYVSTPAELASAVSSAESFAVPATIHLAAGQYDIGTTVGSVNVASVPGGEITLAGAGASSTILNGDSSGSDVVNLGGGGTTTIEGLTIENGRDGIYDNGTLVLDRSLVKNNSAVGIESTNGGLTVSNSTITGNGVSNPSLVDNGGIYVESTFAAVDTTIAGNPGHGIAVDYSGGGASLQNVTIAGNGDGISLSAPISAVNTIVAANSGADCIGPSSQYMVSQGHNLDSDGSCAFTASTDLPSTDPQLGPLQDNGGPTPTMALAPASPAVDAGDNSNCPATDQRGVSRPQGPTCDIGAFELVPGTNPTIQASLDQDNISLHGWPADDVVSVTVADGLPYLVTTDGNGYAFLGVQQTGHDIVPGDVITASDTDGNSQSLTVADLGVDELDPSSGAVAGSAAPGASIQVNENDGSTFLGHANTTADSTGNWFATVPVAPLTGAWYVNAAITDANGNQTTYDVNEPVVSATINQDFVSTWGWPANENLTIDVNGNTFDATTGGGGLPNVGAANLNRDQVGDIQPGSTIDVTGQFYGQTVTKHLQVAGIKIGSVDTATRTVSGTGPANSTIELSGTAVPPGQPPVQTTSDGNGDWSATLPNPLTGQWQVSAQTPDADGDLSTWQTQLPWIGASLTAGSIQGHGWPANDSVTLTIGSTTETATTNANGDFELGGQQQTAALSPGTTIDANDGTYDKQLTLVSMTFDTLDPATQVAAGTAPGGSSVQVCLNQGATFLGCQTATANGDGFWSTTFPDGTIALGVHGVASTTAGDEDGDQTQVEYTVAPAVSLDSTPPDPDTSDGSTFTFSSPAPGAQFQCQVDGGGFQPCSSPDTVYVANGSHTFQVEAGVNGSFGDPATFTWTTNVPAPPADTLVVDAPPNAIDSLDTGIGFLTSSWQVLQATCDTLYTVSSGSPSDIVPLSAAGDPVVSPSGLTATITVRSGLKFANGDDITAQSFADAITRLQSSTLNSPAAYIANGITNVSASGQTLTITMSKPLGDLASRLTVPEFCPVPSGTPDTPVTSEVGSGPYTIVSSGASEIDLARNAYYGGPRSSSFAHIRFDLGVDPAAAEARVLAGTSDYIIGGPPAQDVASLSDGHGSQLAENPALTFWYVGMNTTRAPFDNPVLRRAISYALDRNAIAAAVSRPVTPTDTYVPPGTPGASKPGSFYPLGGDMSTAISLAAQAGVSTASPITATYYAGTNQLARQVEPVVAADLAPLGITLVPTFTPNIYSLIGNPSTPDDLFFSGWAMDYPDPSDIFDNLLHSGEPGSNFAHYSGSDAEIEAADAAPLATRFGQWATVEQDIATNQAPLASVLNATNVDLFSSRVGCEQYNPISGMDIAALCAGSLSGSANQSIVTPVDVTSAGAEDWAVWGRGMSSGQYSLAPTDYKANGGREISNLNVVNGGTPRGFGTDPASPAFTFSWSDGSPLATASGVQAGLTAPSLGTGLSFTVPADRTARTLTIWTTSHYADGTLTAHLSDGSAPDFSQTIHAVRGDFTGSGENAPAIFTLHYQAASAGQHLTVTWSQTANNSCGGCEDIVLYAAALSGGSHVSGASASLSSDSSVGMSGSNDAISDIPLSAFEITPNGITPAPINGLPINGLPINGLPINGLPINGLPINGLPINGLPINGLPINGLPINGLPINGLPINGLPINGLPINGLELPGTSWEQILAGTPLANVPLQDITLQQVLNPHTYAPNPVPAAVQSLTLGDLEVTNSALGQITLGALALGGTPINGLGLPADALAQLEQWCRSNATTSTDCSSLGNYSLFALGLEGAPINGLPINGLPINGLPINGLPINGLPINGLDLSASPINGLPINGLPINGLPINGLPLHELAAVLSDVVDCTKVDCATATLGAAAAAGAIVPGATYGQLLSLLLAPGSPYANTITLGDVIGLLIKRTDVPWEDLSPRLLSAFDSNRPLLHVSAGFTVQGSGTPNADVQVTIPNGFDYDPGSATLSKGVGDAAPLADPTITGHTLDWLVPGVTPGVQYTVGFRLRSGTTVGPAQVTETVSAGSFSDTQTSGFTVADSFPTSGDPNKAPIVNPNAGVQMSALPSAGAVDYFKIPMPPAGDRLQVHLTNLPADYDLALYSSQTTSVRTGAASAPPLQDGIVSDPKINLSGGNNGQLTPTALQDVPDPGIPVVQVSANRGTEDEDVGMVSPGGGGYVTIAVFGYNGAFSPQPYTLRVKDTPPPATEMCAARTLPDAGQGTTPDALPNLGSLPTNLNTVILVDEKRLGDTYGATDEANAVAKLHHLAADTSLGVSGVVLPVEQIPGVQALYDQWDTNPCNPDAANAVANAIANEVDAIKTAAPTVQYVVFAGGDDQIPFFRLPDLSQIANESGFAGQFGPNEYQGSLAAGDLLSDNPYLDTRPIPASGRQLFIPDLVGGRLVESAADIANAVTSFESSGGVLRSSTGFVSGYDFVADGSQLVANRLTALGVNVSTLIDSSSPFVPANSWSLTGLLNAAFPAGGPAWINSWNGHYDNYRAQMANGDILTTANLTGSHAINGGIFFTMGCHAGFQTTDAVIGSSVLDWPQYFSEHNTGFVGNTGFGLGDSDSVAFSEELMADFAGQLGGSLTLGQALTQAKDQYFLSRDAFSNYDEKTLSEAELYGLPMYGVGHAPASLMAAASPSPDPVSGTSSSTSPSLSPLSQFTTGVQSAGFAAQPTFTLQHGANGDFYTNAGQVQAPNYRPLQPFVSLPAGRSGLVAHGVVIDSLSSADHAPFNPDNVRPTVDLSANEPEPQFNDEEWPEKIPSLVTLGSNQSLNLATGQFFTDTSSGTPTGVERLWTQIAGRVTYSNSQDFTPPTIDSIDAYQADGVVSFSGHFSDRDQNGNAGTVAFAQVVYAAGGNTWAALPLQQGSNGTWSGSAPYTGSASLLQFFVEACDAAGNCGYSSNKGRYYDAQPLPPSPTGGSLTLTPSRAPDAAATWYTGSLDVTASASAGAASVSVDGGPFNPASGPVTLSGDGVHVVDARDSGGDTASAVYLIDTTGPAITHSVSPAKPTGSNGWYVTKPTVTFSCADNLSGVASCTAAGGGLSTTLGDGASSTASATASDNAGNSSHDSVSLMVDTTAPATPTFNGILPQLYPINSLPAQSAISCSSSDATSGLSSCKVTGYSGSVGVHTLTATATDNAGNTSTSTLTYTVGFQAGMVLAPVTAPKADQTSPSASDLQVFKIKSTIPLKFQFYLDSSRTTVMTTPPTGSVARLTVGKYNGSTDSIIASSLVTAPADTGDQFRWTGASDYQYIYNMATASLTAGTYDCQITLYDANGNVIGQSLKQYFMLRS